MRIGIDNISPGESTGRKAPGGMRMYLQSLVTEFAVQAPHHQYTLFTPAWADPLLPEYPSNLRVVKLANVPTSRSLRILYQQIALPLALSRHHMDVFFATATIAPLLVPVPVVLAVQFIQFYQTPEAYGHLRTAYLRCVLPLSLKKARKAIIFTEYSKGDLVRYDTSYQPKIQSVLEFRK